MFLSTPPSRVATRANFAPAGLCCFYPRHPRGWRQQKADNAEGLPCFYPRHPRGWRRIGLRCVGVFLGVSIHATLAGGDTYAPEYRPETEVSIHATLAGGDAQARILNSLDFVSIHATLAGGDDCDKKGLSWRGWFLSTPPSRVATVYKLKSGVMMECFYPRHPRGWRLLR